MFKRHVHGEKEINHKGESALEQIVPKGIFLTE